MQLLDTVRRILKMSAQRLSSEEIARRTSAAFADVERARMELEDLESEAASISLASSFDDLAVVRIEKKVETKRAEVSRLEERHRRLQAAKTAQEEIDYAELLGAQREAIDSKLREIVSDYRQVDDSARKFADDLIRVAGHIGELSDLLIKLPRRIGDTPELLTPDLAWLVFVRFYGFAGALAYGSKRGMTKHEAEASAPLVEQAEKARARVMAQIAPTQPANPPRAA